MSSHTDIVFVWVHSGDRAVEDLRYALRSLEDNWGTRQGQTFRVFIVGDRPPGWGDFMHVPHHHESSREKGLVCPKAVDAVRKMNAIINCSTIGERFIYTYDDVCFLKPIDAEYFDRPMANNEMLDTSNFPGSRWGKQVKDTYKALKAYGLRRVWNYETHLPRLFEKKKMREVIERFKPEENRLLLPTLYFNYHHAEVEPRILNKFDDVRAGFYGREAENSFPRSREIDEALACAYHRRLFTGKQFVNWNDEGIKDPGLFYALHSLWPTPSSFEVHRIAIPNGQPIRS